MNELHEIKVSGVVLSTLIAGMYCANTHINPVAIPTSLYIELCEKLIPYLKEWDYETITFEDWVAHCLIIAPKEMFMSNELEEMRKNTIFIERNLGNVTLIATGDI